MALFDRSIAILTSNIFLQNLAGDRCKTPLFVMQDSTRTL
jgi:hypothetical protein